MPRRILATTLLDNEMEWLGVLESDLPLPIPAPVYAGQPGHDYPWKWSIVPWIPGEAADLQSPDPSQAAVFGEFLRTLHRLPHDRAPTSKVRGVPLTQRKQSFEDGLRRMQQHSRLIDAGVLAIWNAALEASAEFEVR